ncbi:MAG: hypothetical protein IIA45_14890, partial [Bacteroidetes bacterium]|nr:hypothetical protein [Bacteroidota bacterium]
MKCNTIKTLVLFTLLILSFFVSNSSYGSHAVGGEITYICLGQDTAGNDIMQVTLVYYRDCLGVDAPNQVTVCYSSVSCGFNSTFSAPKDTVIDVSPICSGLTSTCQGGSYPGIEQHIFIGQVTLTSQCNDWIFSFATCCRNAAITTGPGSSGFYLEACLNNLDAPCNSSPYLANLPIAFVCDSQQFVFNHGATDPDGDSLVYRIIPPMQGGGCNYSGYV